MKILSLIIFISLMSLDSKACLHASQHKIFPIGSKDSLIYCITYKLVRTENHHIKQRFKLNVPDTNTEGFNPFWLIYGSVTIYDKGQTIVENIPVDTSFIAADMYGDSLEKSYGRMLSYMKYCYPDLEYFTPSYCSFCDYQLECDKVSINWDSISKNNFIHYKNKDYLVHHFNDSTQQNYSVNPYAFEEITNLRINSVRVYKNKRMELVFVHLAFSDFIYYYTSDKKLAGKTDEYEMEYRLSKEHKPDFKFNSIEEGFYEEPILHHGFGMDLFICKEK